MSIDRQILSRYDRNTLEETGLIRSKITFHRNLLKREEDYMRIHDENTILGNSSNRTLKKAIA